MGIWGVNIDLENVNGKNIIRNAAGDQVNTVCRKQRVNCNEPEFHVNWLSCYIIIIISSNIFA